MKPKNKIKLHKSVEKVISEATAFVNAAIELHKLKSKPIPEYAKGAKDEFIKQNEVGTYETDLTTGKVVLKNKETFTQAAWNKYLNEYLKGKGFKNDEPFGMAPIEGDDLSKIIDKIKECDSKLTYERSKFLSELCNQDEKPQELTFLNKEGFDEFMKGVRDFESIQQEHINKTPIAPPLGFNHDFHKQAVEAEKELDKVCKPKKECPHENIDIESYRYGWETKTLTVSTCADCGLNLTLEKHSKLKDRRIQIEKEIEKLRIEARQIKKSLKG